MSKIIISHNCACGEVDSAKFYGRQKRVCKKCENQKAKERFRNYKKELVEYMGGKCELCGYSKSIAALHLHHKDPEEKDINYHTMKNWSFTRRKAEADKCILLCANCHAETHDDRLCPISVTDSAKVF